MGSLLSWLPASKIIVSQIIVQNYCLPNDCPKLLSKIIVSQIVVQNFVSQVIVQNNCLTNNCLRNNRWPAGYLDCGHLNNCLPNLSPLISPTQGGDPGRKLNWNFACVHIEIQPWSCLIKVQMCHRTPKLHRKIRQHCRLSICCYFGWLLQILRNWDEQACLL